MVYSIMEGQKYMYQPPPSKVPYADRYLIIGTTEMVTYIGQLEDGNYVFLSRDNKSIKLPTLAYIFEYSIPYEDIYKQLRINYSRI